MRSRKTLPVVALTFGILALLGGGTLVVAYVWEAVIVRAGEPDQSLLFWYLPLLFLGLSGLIVGTAAAAWGLSRLRSMREAIDRRDQARHHPLWHVLLPGLAPAAIVALYFTPVSLIGCANRGLIALAVVFAAFIAGIVAATVALRLRQHDRQRSSWWVLSALILCTPAILVFGFLG